MKNRVAIIGMGQIGSRHLQGLIKCNIPLEIFAIDPNQKSLILSENRMKEVSLPSNIHHVNFSNSFDSLVGEVIDLVILSTSSEGRADLISKLSKQIDIRYWVLEKVLAQSKYELTKILNLLKNCSGGAWVNTPRRTMNWYREIVKTSPKDSIIDCLVTGEEWGLACNAVHFLDLVTWLSGAQVEKIQTENLAPKWHKSKREGYWEIFGSLRAIYSNGSILTLKCMPKKEEFKISIKSNDNEWIIKEQEGIANKNDGTSIPGKLDYQSEITGNLIETILKEGTCELPDLETSVRYHKVLINALLKDWNNKMLEKKTKLPIT